MMRRPIVAQGKWASSSSATSRSNISAGNMRHFERDIVDAGRLDKSAGLFKAISLYFNADVWSLLPKLTNLIGKTGKSSDGGEMIVFYQHHVVQTKPMITASSGNYCSLF